MKTAFLYTILMVFATNAFAQQKTYDLVTYTSPSGWTEKESEGNISYSKIDGGSWAQIAIYQHRPSEGAINTDFDKDWNELVATGKTISSPEKTMPQTAEGWTVISGIGVWQYNGVNVASMLTVYTNNKVCVAILCNTTAQPYLKDYKSLIGTLDLDANSVSATSRTANKNSSANTNNPALVGLWIDYNAETTGAYFNGMPQYTAGYTRKEYAFYVDGSYLFRKKQWLTSMKEILFVYETGTYSITSSQLTINPQKGMGEWWSKAGQQANAWGKRLKVAEYKMEKVTYTFEMKYFSGSQDYSLILKSGKPTQREGGRFNNANDPYEFRYSLREKLGSLIDNPPGFKTGFENRSLSSPAASQTNTTTANSPLAGKIWEGITPEKYDGGNMSNYNTGGFFTYQYKFNTDGTYRFIYIGASAYTQPNLLQYETGTYAVNGNKLTILPTSGSNEEWSVVGGPVNLAGMSDVGIRKIKESWGKRSKTEKRKLEKVTYTISTEYWKGNNANALKLQWDGGKTVREGNGEFTYYLETTPEKATILPNGFTK